ncbi:hypothetical protein GCM10009769_03470 [Curtobacterium luteum]|uniref:Uncharacterized protein n=1 Tax=Curtobacterium luteum TaxID=33881 RepID=A0A8H9KWZ4_9MICO|nr:hypothetical protein GCM10009769_03470 [Curtobacterium luteum]
MPPRRADAGRDRVPGALRPDARLAHDPVGPTTQRVRHPVGRDVDPVTEDEEQPVGQPPLAEPGVRDPPDRRGGSAMYGM